MRVAKSLVPGLTFAALAVVSLGARQPPDDLGRATLADGDGWAAFGAGTTAGPPRRRTRSTRSPPAASSSRP